MSDINTPMGVIVCPQCSLPKLTGVYGYAGPQCQCWHPSQTLDVAGTLRQPSEEVRELRAELAASRHELVGAKKSANAQARTIESLQQQREHLHVQRDQWIEARNTLESERAANARLTEELAASREREARMRGALRNLLALDADHQRGADDEDVCAEVREARAALAEGAQG